MLGFSRAKRFFPYDEGQEAGEIYLVMAPARRGAGRLFTMTWTSSTWTREEEGC